MPDMRAPKQKLYNGVEIPQIGLGTWPMKDSEAVSAVEQALRMGYRLIDTASAYQNEAAVGKGIRNSGVGRDEVFITSKARSVGHGFKEAKTALEGSLSELETDYLDLYLIHWPKPMLDKYVDTWRAFIEMMNEGKIRAIGVSNFKQHHIERLIDETGVTPMVNQLQLHPAIARSELREFNEQHGIVTESWSPLGLGANDVVFGSVGDLLTNPVITEIAAEHGRSPAQVILRWHVQLGLIPIPKSSNSRRLEENLNVFDFELNAKAMSDLSALDQGEAAAVDSDIHDE